MISFHDWSRGLRVCITPNAVWDLDVKDVLYGQNPDGHATRPFATLSRMFNSADDLRAFLDEKLPTHYVVVYCRGDGMLWPHNEGFILMAVTLDKEIW